MREALKLYYGTILPALWKRRQLSLMIIFWFIFHLGPLVARARVEPWEQPLIYANF